MVEGGRHGAGPPGRRRPDLGLFDAFLTTPFFAPLHRSPIATAGRRDGRWWAAWLLAAFVPAVTYFLVPLGAPLPFKPFGLLPQSITNSLMAWALVNVLLAVAFSFWPGRRVEARTPMWGRSALMAAGVVGVLYLVVMLAGLVQVDFRFWVVALKPLSARQMLAALGYVVPFTLFVTVAFRGLSGLSGNAARAHYGWAAGALATGFLMLTGAQYVALFTSGHLPLRRALSAPSSPCSSSPCSPGSDSWPSTRGDAPAATRPER